MCQVPLDPARPRRVAHDIYPTCAWVTYPSCAQALSYFERIGGEHPGVKRDAAATPAAVDVSFERSVCEALLGRHTTNGGSKVAAANTNGSSSSSSAAAVSSTSSMDGGAASTAAALAAAALAQAQGVSGASGSYDEYDGGGTYDGDDLEGDEALLRRLEQQLAAAQQQQHQGHVQHSHHHHHHQQQQSQQQQAAEGAAAAAAAAAAAVMAHEAGMAAMVRRCRHWTACLRVSLYAVRRV